MPPSTDVVIAWCALVVFTAVSLLGAWAASKATGSWLNYRTLLLVNFAVTIPVSGMVHLWNNNPLVGHFALIGIARVDELSTALVTAAIATITLVVGCLRRLGSDRDAIERHGFGSRVHMTWTWRLAPVACALPLAIYSLIRIRGYASEQTSERIVAVEPGLAKFVFMSHWVAICVVVIACLIIGRWCRTRASVFAVMALAAIAVFQSMSWSGGRSIGLVMVLPLMVAARMRLGRIPWFYAAGGGIALWFFVTATTAARAADQSYDMTSMGSILDWQWGRFSMLGFASHIVDQGGYYHGSTMLAGIVNFASGITSLLHLDLPWPHLLTGNQLAGITLFNDPTKSYVVIGFIGESFLNFGYLGVAVGCYALGRITAFADDRAFKSTDLPRTLWWNYVASLLVFRTINSDFGAILGWAFLSGFPLLVSAALASIIYRGPPDSTTADDAPIRLGGSPRDTSTRGSDRRARN